METPRGGSGPTTKRSSARTSGRRPSTSGPAPESASSCPEVSFMEQAQHFSASPLETPVSSIVPPPCTSAEAGSVTLGVCAMSKKCASKPMQAILSRIESYGFIKVVIFEDETILHKPVTEWPHCDALISFFSTGFPLDKAIEYAELVKPFLVNDLETQFLLQHRPSVYAELERNGIETPRFKVLDRSIDSPVEVIEDTESISIDGDVFVKPFVEKPVDAENHHVYIYYPPSAGGGSQRLFRKIHNRSSVYSVSSKVRDHGSYIYEEFMPTDGTDVKVYTVGPQYAHAEARKSPALDGKVDRDAQGKEVRYPVILSAYEKEIARKVCLAFKQDVCGFDLLRAHGKSFVCDVNGFSFVKTSQKYYDDSAQILSEMIINKCAPHLFRERIIQAVPVPNPQPSGEPSEELRCVIGIIRHGDRTPKQKMKMVVRHEKFYNLFLQNGGNRKLNVKLKKPEQLQEVLDVARSLVETYEVAGADCAEIEERENQLQQLKSVLEMHGYFSGINRKVQMKYRPHKRPPSSSSGSLRAKSIANREAADSSAAADTEIPNPTSGSLLLILKWGGELTPAGRSQAKQLGKEFRCIYPGGQGEYGALPGSGLLRLHSTYRHDLKIYASDEGRVQTTAAAFAKGFLALEGELTPILVHLVKTSRTNSMLDKSDAASDLMCSVKERLHEILRKECNFTAEDVLNLAPTLDTSLTRAISDIGNPTKLCERLNELVTSMVEQIQAMDAREEALTLYYEESLGLMLSRWEKLKKEFKRKGKFDYSKIPDIFDCIKYDILHNRHVGLKNTQELFEAAAHLANIVIPQEYGITAEEKAEIARLICTPLARKIRGDLRHQTGDFVHQLDPEYSRDITSPRRNVRTRLYFTSESHIHSILNLLIHGQLLPKPHDLEWTRAMDYVSASPEYSYMTQIVFLLFEVSTKAPDDKERFRVEVHFSPGASVQARGESKVSSSSEHSGTASKDDHALDRGSDLVDGGTAGMSCSPPHSYSSWKPPASASAVIHGSPPSAGCKRSDSSATSDESGGKEARQGGVERSTSANAGDAMSEQAQHAVLCAAIVAGDCSSECDKPAFESRVEPLRVLHRNIPLPDFDTFLDHVLEGLEPEG